MPSLVVGTNSYITLAEADTIASELYTSSCDELKFWNALTDEDKAVVIIQGTVRFESMMFLGSKKTSEQSMQFPRVRFGKEVNITPLLKNGIVEMSLVNAFRSGKYESKLQALGVKSYSVEGASVSFQEGSFNSAKGNISSELFARYFTNYAY